MLRLTFNPLLIIAVLIVGLLCLTQTGFSNHYTYQLKPGETVNSVAFDYLANPAMLDALMEYNDITDPSVVQPGMEINIPYALSKDRRAKVVFVDGEVLAGVRGNVAPLRENDFLLENHRVLTRDGRTELVLDEGTHLRIGANTRFVLDQFTYDRVTRKTNIRLEHGVIALRVTRLNGAAEFHVSTVSAVVGVRGTSFIVKYDEQLDETRIYVASGTVEVRHHDQMVAVPAGYATVVNQSILDPVHIPAQIEWEDTVEWIELPEGW
jgi:hypothetical protein